MNTRGLFVSAVIGVLSVGALPALAQHGMGPGWWSGPQGATSQPLSMAQAEEIARQAIARSGFQGLVPMREAGEGALDAARTEAVAASVSLRCWLMWALPNSGPGKSVGGTGAIRNSVGLCGGAPRPRTAGPRRLRGYSEVLAPTRSHPA